MRADVFTLFPGMFDGPMGESILRRARDAGLIDVRAHNVRDFTTDKHHITDDYAYGGGGGMVMKPEPMFSAVETVMALSGVHNVPDQGKPRFFVPGDHRAVPVILMSPAGDTFSHAMALELATYPRLAFVCGHYEGVDERVAEHLCTHAISIGDYVLTGGELPAMVIIDAVARQIPGVLPEFAPKQESHADGALEYPHYTRPADFRGWRVPDVLLSGDHAKITKWRAAQSAARTAQRAEKQSKAATAP
jgi:tRNA (guanine37-N1)-methyltransferase